MDYDFIYGLIVVLVFDPYRYRLLNGGTSVDRHRVFMLRGVRDPSGRFCDDPFPPFNEYSASCRTLRASFAVQRIVSLAPFLVPARPES